MVTFAEEPTECIIEFQAFRGNDNSFIIKELAILDLQTYLIYPFMFKPPFLFKELNSKSKRTNKWLTKNFHHISWDDGFTDLRDLDSIMYHFGSKFTRIHTKGSEKRNWIQLYTTAEVNDVTIDKTIEYNVNNVCLLAKNKRHKYCQCALKNAYRLAEFLHGGGSGEGYKYEQSEEPPH